MGFLNIIFPPLCLSCKEEATTKHFCSSCWDLCILPDPAEKCRHCFSDLDIRGRLCQKCRKSPPLKSPSAYVFASESPATLLDLEPFDAMASFAYLQWLQLEWPQPDYLVPMPDKHSLAIGYELACLLKAPFAKGLTFNHQIKEDRLEEEKVILLFDVANEIADLQKADIALYATCPEKVFILSLFET